MVKIEPAAAWTDFLVAARSRKREATGHATVIPGTRPMLPERSKPAHDALASF
jgi:hypothetical protein